MSAKPKILFYVQHLLGIGHVFRAVRVARALAAAGCETHVAWGGTRIEGMNTSGLKMTYLEAVRVEGEDFKNLLLGDGSVISEAGKSARAKVLLDLFSSAKPDIVITEAYPFGRRQMRFELLPLLDAIKAADWKPMLVSSIRDIMQEGRADKRVRESADLIHQFFDLVMVHGDPELIPIEATLQAANEFSDKVRYSGLVTPDPINYAIKPSVSAKVLISAGGGAVGKGLMDVAAHAMRHCKAFPSGWVLITGPDLPHNDFDRLQQVAGEGMTVLRFVTDLARIMAEAEVSVSRAGYNTVGDVLRAQTRSILVPFMGGLETEQLKRAQIMDRLGIAKMIDESELTPRSLAGAIDAIASSPAPVPQFDLNGADNAAQLLISEYSRFRG